MATLATDRALLLLGVPGTAKSWVSEHLAAAISGDSTLLVQGTAGHRRGGHPLRLELRPAAGRGSERRGPGAVPGDDRDAARRHRPHRGADPDSGRRAGRPDHRAVGEDAAGPGARQRGAGAQGIQRDRHRQRPRQGGQRSVVRTASPVQHRGAAAAAERGGRGRDRHRPSRTSWHRAGTARGARRLEEIRRVVTVFRELRSGSPPTAGRSSSRRRARFRRPRRSRWSPAASLCPRTSATACSGPPTSPPARGRGHQGPGGRPGGVERVPRGGCARTRGWADFYRPAASRDRDESSRSPGAADPPLQVFGIRHHGPGSASSLRRRSTNSSPTRS